MTGEAPRLHSTGSGPAVLLLHPLGVDRSVWEPVAAQLPGLTVITCDLPGHGETPAGSTAVGDLADQLALALREIGALPAHVVGVSLGGLVGQALAARHPEVVARLVVADAVAIYPPAMQQMWTDRAALVRAEGMGPVVDPTIELWFTQRAREEGRATVADVRGLLEGADPEGYARACELLASVDTRHLLADIAAPTLVVCGDDDAPAFTAAAPVLAGAVRNGELVWIPGARHAGAVEQPEVFAGLLRSFLLEQPDQA
jgi:3-oxoadipate enol-lactonase